MIAIQVKNRLAGSADVEEFYGATARCVNEPEIAVVGQNECEMPGFSEEAGHLFIRYNRLNYPTLVLANEFANWCDSH